MEMVYCGNSIYSHALKANGGQEVFGSCSECFKKGFARGFNQKVADVPPVCSKVVRQVQGAHTTEVVAS